MSKIINALDLFNKWMEKKFGEDSEWDEGWNRGTMFQAFVAGRKSRDKKRSPNKFSSAIEDFRKV